MASDTPDRLPPRSQEAERAVLGSMLRDNAIIDDVVHIVQTDCFYEDGHQKIFQAILDLHNKPRPADLTILGEELLQRKQYDDVGGAPYLWELWNATPTAANAIYYAQIVRDRSLVRNLIHASTEILRDAYDQSQPPDDMLAAAERLILEIAEKGTTGKTSTLADSVNDAFTRLSDRQLGTDLSISGLATGYTDLDEITAGLQNSELVIIAARPSVGKTAYSLNLVRNIAVDNGHPVFFVSLEQSRIELAERLLCCQSRVDSHKLRKGNLSRDDMDKLIAAADVLREAKLFIDDTPGQGMMRIAANARRLQRRNGIKLVVIDYLQLIDPENRRDPRQEQVAQISRRLKFLARELELPVVALAQVNRSSEDRQDHRPRLADLRESGCLVGDTLVTLAATGKRVPISELVGKSGFDVWALDETTLKNKPAEVSHAFCTGIKPIFRLTTRLGRTIRATGNHKFRAFGGWQRLDELKVGDHLAVPRHIPCNLESSMTDAQVGLLGHLLGDGCTLPRHAIQYTTREIDLAQIVATLALEVFGGRVRPRISPELRWYQVYLASAESLTHGKRNPVAKWLDGMGAFGFRSWEKRVPGLVFEQPEATIATFLRHLWATDGCIRPPQNNHRHPSIYYASSSGRLAQDVQELLLRLGINAVLRGCDQGDKGRRQYHLSVTGKEDLLIFADVIGAVGNYKSVALNECREWLVSRVSNTNRDIIPCGLWQEYVKPAMQDRKITMRQLQHGIGMACMGTGLYKQNVSRERLSRVAASLGGEPSLEALFKSEVYWDQVISIEPDGEEAVYDLTVPGPSNFIADGMYVHNSIEQDADTVMLLHRPDRYEPGQNDSILEVIIGKQRNGPTGEITLAYIKQYMRFENFAVGTPFDS